MARRTGHGDSPLGETALAQLQGDILGKRTTLTHFGLRQSPVFVGETVRYQNIVNYVAPPQDEVSDILQGLREFLERPKGNTPVNRRAVADLGLVQLPALDQED